MNDSNKCCLLCNDKPEKGFHLNGTKFIKGNAMTYQLCEKCCLEVDSKSLDAPTTRKIIWEKVEKALLRKSD